MLGCGGRAAVERWDVASCNVACATVQSCTCVAECVAHRSVALSSRRLCRRSREAARSSEDVDIAMIANEHDASPFRRG